MFFFSPFKFNCAEKFVIEPVNSAWILFCKREWNCFFSTSLFASKDILILPPINNSKGIYNPNLSINFSNNIFFSVALESWISINSSFICFDSFISLKSMTILNKLTTIEWIQWIFELNSEVSVNFSSLKS